MSTDIKFPYCKPEIWGGIECTINRVDNNYRDQLEVTGHYDRGQVILKQLQHWVFENCGTRCCGKIISHDADGEIDWTWTEQQLNTIRTTWNRCLLQDCCIMAVDRLYRSCLMKILQRTWLLMQERLPHNFPGLNIILPLMNH